MQGRRYFNPVGPPEWSEATLEGRGEENSTALLTGDATRFAESRPVRPGIIARSPATRDQLLRFADAPIISRLEIYPSSRRETKYSRR
jgi:hypothetical protein